MVGHKTDTFYWEFSPHNICEVNYTEYNDDDLDVDCFDGIALFEFLPVPVLLPTMALVSVNPDASSSSYTRKM